MSIDRRSLSTVQEIARLFRGRKKPLTAREVAEKLGRKLTTTRSELAYAELDGVVKVVGTRPTGGRGRPANLYLGASELR